MKQFYGILVTRANAVYWLNEGRIMATAKDTINALINLNDVYLAHLNDAIVRLCKEMPSDVQDQYKDGEQIVVSQLLDQMGTGLSLYWKNNMHKYQWEEHSSTKHPQLNLALSKYKLVQEMSALLTASGDATDEQRLAQFREKLTPENKSLLGDRRDSNWGLWFLEQIMHVLTLGVYSKVTKGTFQFWKSHGESFVDKENELLSNTPPASN